MISDNPLSITNSQLAKVQYFQEVIKAKFDKEFSQFQERKDFYTNIYTVTRFSIAREFKEREVVELWANWVKWYQSYKPDQISPEDETVLKLHKSQKYRFAGVDKSGCPILVIRMRYHMKGLATVEQNIKYLIYMIEKGAQMARKANTHQLAIIYDRRDLEDSDDVSKESMKKFMPMLNDYYPQTLKSFYVLGANTFYRVMWKIVSVFISKRTQDKINLLESVEKLQESITKENLLQEYGGVLEI